MVEEGRLQDGIVKLQYCVAIEILYDRMDNSGQCKS